MHQHPQTSQDLTPTTKPQPKISLAPKTSGYSAASRITGHILKPCTVLSHLLNHNSALSGHMATLMDIRKTTRKTMLVMLGRPPRSSLLYPWGRHVKIGIVLIVTVTIVIIMTIMMIVVVVVVVVVIIIRTTIVLRIYTSKEDKRL